VNTIPFSCPACLTVNALSASHCVTCGQPLTVAAARAATVLAVPIPDAASETLLPGATLKSGAYTILEVMGQGGFGITYKAQGRTGFVAIKESFPHDLALRLPGGRVVSRDHAEFERLLVRFQFEAETLQLMKHPSATQFLEFFTENGTAYLVMEFLEGETLETRIARGEPLRFMEARRVLFAVLEVLRELHSLGLLHRDIKPANLIFTRAGVELIDYGSAVKYRVGERIKRERLLTPMYAPLEQFGETVALAPGTDLYALGATLYHALTLHAPPTALERAKGASFNPRDALPMGDPAVNEVIAHCLEMRLEDRPKSAAELLEVLRYGYFTLPDPSAVLPSGRSRLPSLDLSTFTDRANIIAALTMFALFLFLFIAIPR
jgi:serine/threonine protein kinase